jgi:hypothetical protein
MPENALRERLHVLLFEAAPVFIPCAMLPTTPLICLRLRLRACSALIIDRKPPCR